MALVPAFPDEATIAKHRYRDLDLKEAVWAICPRQYIFNDTEMSPGIGDALGRWHGPTTMLDLEHARIGSKATASLDM